MDFVIQWLCYVVAFVAGSAVAWVIATVSIRRRHEQDTVDAPQPDGAGAAQ
ncbi:hypothetical protein [Mycobacterium sp.]|uniref:channel accessory protein ArfB n=1 Tax=Mycobacterium sp. TaxID=1785 RepID=UPI003BAC3521